MQKTVTNLITLAFVLVLFAGVTPTASAQAPVTDCFPPEMGGTDGDACVLDSLDPCDINENLGRDCPPPEPADCEADPMQIACAEEAIGELVPVAEVTACLGSVVGAAMGGELACDGIVDTSILDDIAPLPDYEALGACLMAASGEFTEDPMTGFGAEAVATAIVGCIDVAPPADLPDVEGILTCIVNALLTYVDAQGEMGEGQTLIAEGERLLIGPGSLANEMQLIEDLLNCLSDVPDPTCVFGDLAEGGDADPLCLIGGTWESAEVSTGKEFDGNFYARSGDAIDFEATATDDTITVTGVDLTLDGALVGPANDFDFTDGVLTADFTAGSGDGELRALIHWEDAEGAPGEDFPSDNLVTLDNTDPDAIIDFTSAQNGVHDNGVGDVAWDITLVDVGGVDADASTHTSINTDGATDDTLAVADDSYTLGHAGDGTFTVTLDLVDYAGNDASISDSVEVATPPVTATIASDNGKDTALGIDEDVVTLTIDAPIAFVGFDEATDISFTIGGQDVAGAIGWDDTGAPEYIASFALDGDLDLEGAVEFSLTYDLGSGDATLDRTVDDSSVTADFTAPAPELSFPGALPNGNVGGAEGGSLAFAITMPADFDVATAAVAPTVSITFDAGPEEVFNFGDVTPTEDADTGALTYLFETTEGAYDNGDAIVVDVAVVEDLAGNTADPDAFAPVNVQTVHETVQIAIMEGGTSANDDVRYVGLEGYEARTYRFIATHESLSSEAKGMAYINVQFELNGAGNSFQLVSVDHDNALVFFDEDGNIEDIEVELESIVKDGTVAFDVTVRQNVDDPMATEDQVDIQAGAAAFDFSDLGYGGFIAATIVESDILGPTIGGHDYDVSGDDNVIDYTEFTESEDGIVAALLDIVDQGGAGATGAIIGHAIDEFGVDQIGSECTDEGFVQLGSADVDAEAGTADVDIDDSLLNSGPRFLLACAVDALGNVGPANEVELDIAIRQYIHVIPSTAENLWIGPNSEALRSFDIEPIDVVHDIRRYDLREDDDYALSAFVAPGASSGQTGEGGLKLVRFNNPAEAAPTSVVDGVAHGFANGEHGTLSEYNLIVLNNLGRSDVFEIVSGDYPNDLTPFSGAVFSAQLDALAPTVVFTGIPQDADGDFTLAASDDQELIIELTMVDDDSGLPDGTVPVLQVYDADADEWGDVADQTPTFADGVGSISTPMDVAGRYMFRIAGTDAVGNEGYSESFTVNLVGSAQSAVVAVFEQGSAPLVADADGLLYADLDSSTPGVAASDADAVTITATVDLDGDAYEGVDVELVFAGQTLPGVTDVAGQFAWTIDPDAYALDLEQTTFLVAVPSQTLAAEDADIAVGESAASNDVLWTGFYAQARGADLAAPGSQFDVAVGVYWLHEVWDAELGQAVVVDGVTAPVEDDVTGMTIGLIEKIGNQGLSAADNPDAVADAAETVFNLVRGVEPVVGTASDADAGYRRYAPTVGGDFPNGLDGVVRYSDDHEVLVSALRLVVDSADQFGAFGEDAEVTVSAEWLHEFAYSGAAHGLDIPTGISVNLPGANEEDLVLDGGATFVYAFPLGVTNAAVLSGLHLPDDLDETAVTVFGAEVDIHGYDLVLSAAALADGTEPGAPGADAGVFEFTATLNGLDVGDDFGGLDLDLEIRQAGEAPIDTGFEPVAFGSQTPFAVIDNSGEEPESLPLVGDFAFDTDHWEFTLEAPELGVYDLVMDLAVVLQGGNVFTVEDASTVSVAQTVFSVASGVTGTDDGEGGLDAVIADEFGTFWFDESVGDATHGVTVSRVTSDGEQGGDPVAVDDGTIVEVWQYDAETDAWTFVEEIATAGGAGAASYTVSHTEGDAESVLLRFVVDEVGTVNAGDMTDGLSLGTLPYEVEFVFTAIELAFLVTGDSTALTGQDHTVGVVAFYSHDGSPVDGLDLEFTSAVEGFLGGGVLATDEIGGVEGVFTFAEPTVVGDLAIGVPDLGVVPNGLAAPGDIDYAGALSWVELAITELSFEAKPASGGAWSDPEVIADGGTFTTDAGNIVRITATVRFDDGSGGVAVTQGNVLFGSTAREISAGEAQHQLYRSSPGSQDINLRIEDASTNGADFFDLEDAGSFSVVYQ